ncbi:hypothetical protein ACFPRL_11795 [Pseudoclavibacter helvolus]
MTPGSVRSIVSWISPPPPTTASTHPAAKPPAMTSASNQPLKPSRPVNDSSQLGSVAAVVAWIGGESSAGVRKEASSTC